MSDLRSAFEAYYSDNGKWPGAVRRTGDAYRLAAAQDAWTTWQAAYQAATERAARIADGYAKRDFPWASENSDTYHAQADWAQLIAAAIRGTEEG